MTFWEVDILRAGILRVDILGRAQLIYALSSSVNHDRFDYCSALLCFALHIIQGNNLDYYAVKGDSCFSLFRQDRPGM